jgi:very-short-patch-repair endonuclease
MWTWLRDRRFSAYKFRRPHPYPPDALDFFCIETMVNIELTGISTARRSTGRKMRNAMHGSTREEGQ